MSWCTKTATTDATINHAIKLRAIHTPRWTTTGKRCSDCGERWNRHGCRHYLWATDYLSHLSTIVLPDRPSRPKSGRHRESYTSRLIEATYDAHETIRGQLWPPQHTVVWTRPAPSRPLRGFRPPSAARA